MGHPRHLTTNPPTARYYAEKRQINESIGAWHITVSVGVNGNVEPTRIDFYNFIYACIYVIVQVESIGSTTPALKLTGLILPTRINEWSDKIGIHVGCLAW